MSFRQATSREDQIGTLLHRDEASVRHDAETGTHTISFPLSIPPGISVICSVILPPSFPVPTPPIVRFEHPPPALRHPRFLSSPPDSAQLYASFVPPLVTPSAIAEYLYHPSFEAMAWAERPVNVSVALDGAIAEFYAEAPLPAGSPASRNSPRGVPPSNALSGPGGLPLATVGGGIPGVDDRRGAGPGPMAAAPSASTAPVHDPFGTTSSQALPPVPSTFPALDGQSVDQLQLLLGDDALAEFATATEYHREVTSLVVAADAEVEARARANAALAAELRSAQEALTQLQADAQRGNEELVRLQQQHQTLAKLFDPTAIRAALQQGADDARAEADAAERAFLDGGSVDKLRKDYVDARTQYYVRRFKLDHHMEALPFAPRDGA
eukprot:TRINITY_DN25849_c0_g1_i1.p1 TRINITY_DN25849_c0_g1~~TRINITY_DN25849_c0_g1_i1.p1  ORF type:complete len:396 (-),score=74.69 TRINITY_DN25849_c0_g1_i1:82-1230(-)